MKRPFVRNLRYTRKTLQRNFDSNQKNNFWKEIVPSLISLGALLISYYALKLSYSQNAELKQRQENDSIYISHRDSLLNIRDSVQTKINTEQLFAIQSLSGTTKKQFDSQVQENSVQMKMSAPKFEGGTVNGLQMSVDSTMLTFFVKNNGKRTGQLTLVLIYEYNEQLKIFNHIIGSANELVPPNDEISFEMMISIKSLKSPDTYYCIRLFYADEFIPIKEPAHIKFSLALKGDKLQKQNIPVSQQAKFGKKILDFEKNVIKLKY